MVQQLSHEAQQWEKRELVCFADVKQHVCLDCERTWKCEMLRVPC